MIKIYQDLLLKNGLKSMINYNVNKEIRIKTSMLRCYLCDFYDAYIFVKGNTSLEGDNDANKRKKNLAFKIMHHLLIVFQKLMT